MHTTWADKKHEIARPVYGRKHIVDNGNERRNRRRMNNHILWQYTVDDHSIPLTITLSLTTIQAWTDEHKTLMHNIIGCPLLTDLLKCNYNSGNIKWWSGSLAFHRALVRPCQTNIDYHRPILSNVGHLCDDTKNLKKITKKLNRPLTNWMPTTLQAPYRSDMPML